MELWRIFRYDPDQPRDALGRWADSDAPQGRWMRNSGTTGKKNPPLKDEVTEILSALHDAVEQQLRDWKDIFTGKAFAKAEKEDTMPMPKPGDKEDQETFMERCMSTLEGEFPDQKQRAAVCLKQWRGEDAKKMDLSVIFKAAKGKIKQPEKEASPDSQAIEVKREKGYAPGIGGSLFIPHNG